MRSRIAIGVTYFSYKWDKWDDELKQGERGRKLMMSGGIAECSEVVRIASHLSRLIYMDADASPEGGEMGVGSVCERLESKLE